MKAISQGFAVVMAFLLIGCGNRSARDHAALVEHLEAVSSSIDEAAAAVKERDAASAATALQEARFRMDRAWRYLEPGADDRDQTIGGKH